MFIPEVGKGRARFEEFFVNKYLYYVSIFGHGPGMTCALIISLIGFYNDKLVISQDAGSDTNMALISYTAACAFLIAHASVVSLISLYIVTIEKCLCGGRGFPCFANHMDEYYYHRHIARFWACLSASSMCISNIALVVGATGAASREFNYMHNMMAMSTAIFNLSCAGWTILTEATGGSNFFVRRKARQDRRLRRIDWVANRTGLENPWSTGYSTRILPVNTEINREDINGESESTDSKVEHEIEKQ